MSNHVFQFAVLRYVHDLVTQEFLNIGVVVYCKEARFFKAIISQKYARLSSTFLSINSEYYRRIVYHINRQIERTQARIQQGSNGDMEQLSFLKGLPDQIEILLAQVLTPDDSSLVFAGYGGGLTDDLEAELTKLYARLVEKYTEKEERPSRSDQEVWQVYRRELEKLNVTRHLGAVTIETPTYAYEFHHAWKNERWHPIEPISFDLMHESSILDKANRWIGRTTMLADSNDIGTLHILLGAPKREELQQAYRNATNNLRAKIPQQLAFELVEEDQAEEFSNKMSEQIQQHITE